MTLLVCAAELAGLGVLLLFFFVVFLLVSAITVACSQATVESIAVAGQKKPIPVGSSEGSCGEGVIEGRDFLVWPVSPGVRR